MLENAPEFEKESEDEVDLVARPPHAPPLPVAVIPPTNQLNIEADGSGSLLLLPFYSTRG